MLSLTVGNESYYKQLIFRIQMTRLVIAHLGRMTEGIASQ